MTALRVAGSSFQKGEANSARSDDIKCRTEAAVTELARGSRATQPSGQCGINIDLLIVRVCAFRCGLFSSRSSSSPGSGAARPVSHLAPLMASPRGGVCPSQRASVSTTDKSACPSVGRCLATKRAPVDERRLMLVHGASLVPERRADLVLRVPPEKSEDRSVPDAPDPPRAGDPQLHEVLGVVQPALL